MSLSSSNSSLSSIIISSIFSSPPTESQFLQFSPENIFPLYINSIFNLQSLHTTTASELQRESRIVRFSDSTLELFSQLLSSFSALSVTTPILRRTLNDLHHQLVPDISSSSPALVSSSASASDTLLASSEAASENVAAHSGAASEKKDDMIIDAARNATPPVDDYILVSRLLATAEKETAACAVAAASANPTGVSSITSSPSST